MANVADIREEIAASKEERGAVIMVHNYQRPEVQDVGDVVADSLGLAQKAQETDARVIVLCGVRFMAETAALLNPAKTVLLPDDEALCPMADMVDAADLRRLREEHAGAVVVSYVNTTAETKAYTDICCTSANAVKVVNSVPPDKEIIFAPDKNLGAYVQKVSGRSLIIWQGFCPTHERITPDKVSRAKRQHPHALVVVHPECRMDVIEMADAVRSTSGMLSFCEAAAAEEFIIGTEREMLYPLSKRCPDKRFWPVEDGVVCPNMKKITLAKVRDALRDMKYKVTVPPGVAEPARRSLERMLAVGRDAGA